MGRIAEAEPLLRKAVELNERVLGGSHPQTLSTTVSPVYGSASLLVFSKACSERSAPSPWAGMTASVAQSFFAPSYLSAYLQLLRLVSIDTLET